MASTVMSYLALVWKLKLEHLFCYLMVYSTGCTRRDGCKLDSFRRRMKHMMRLHQTLRVGGIAEVGWFLLDLWRPEANV